MREVKVVKANTLQRVGAKGKYQPFLDAAMKMAEDEAVIVDLTDAKNPCQAVVQALKNAGLSDTLRARTVNKVVCIQRR